MAAKNRDEEISRNLSLSARSFLTFANRHSGGGDYEQLDAALDRLTATRFRTMITTGGHVWDRWFGLVERVYVKRTKTKDGREGRIEELRITLSAWLFDTINANEVLSMHPDYFQLRKRWSA